MLPQQVIIVGAGLAGLCCGRELALRGIPFYILEAADGVGGRVRTDFVDGFRLDRGLQNYLTSYPEGKRILDYSALDLKPFSRALLVRFAGKFHRLADPKDEFLTALKSAFNPIGTVRDKLAAAKLKAAVRREPEQNADSSTADFLRSIGIGNTMLKRLFHPFLSSVFLEAELATSAQFFRFVYHLFGQGSASLPSAGIQAIPEQIAAGLPANSIRLNTPVRQITDTGVTLQNGEKLPAKIVVIATEGPEAVRLSGFAIPEVGSNSTVTLYYAAPKSPLDEPLLMLDGDGNGPATTVAVVSDVAREYAPPNQALIAASVIEIPDSDDETLNGRVRAQLTNWFGNEVNSWKYLRQYRIRHALPSQGVGVLKPWQRSVKIHDHLFICGDHRDNASIDGAMTSGRRTAEAIAEQIG
jgi:protoporphyrinogen oxidase